MNEFLELVKERPDPSLTIDHICPFCESSVKDQGYSTTLVGGGNNHRWYNCHCEECGESFYHEVKENSGRSEEEWLDGANHWYTKDGKVLKGIPTCFESYIYTCTHCNGDVHRKYLEKDGSPSNGIISYVGGKIKQTILFECQDCGESVESSNEYYRKKPPTEPKPLKYEWTFNETIAPVSNNYFYAPYVTKYLECPEGPEGKQGEDGHD